MNVSTTSIINLPSNYDVLYDGKLLRESAPKSIMHTENGIKRKVTFAPPEECWKIFGIFPGQLLTYQEGSSSMGLRKFKVLGTVLNVGGLQINPQLWVEIDKTKKILDTIKTKDDLWINNYTWDEPHIIDKDQTPTINKRNRNNPSLSDHRDILIKKMRASFPDDISFEVEGQMISANSNLVKQGSSVFKALLEGGFKETFQKNIPISERSYEDFKLLIEYFHTGIIIIDENNILAIADLVDYYNVEDLKTTILERFEDLLTIDSALVLLKNLSQNNFLFNTLKKYIIENEAKFFSQLNDEELKDIPPNIISELYKELKLQISKSKFILWIDSADLKNRAVRMCIQKICSIISREEKKPFFDIYSPIFQKLNLESRTHLQELVLNEVSSDLPDIGTLHCLIKISPLQDKLILIKACLEASIINGLPQFSEQFTSFLFDAAMINQEGIEILKKWIEHADITNKKIRSIIRTFDKFSNYKNWNRDLFETYLSAIKKQISQEKENNFETELREELLTVKCDIFAVIFLTIFFDQSEKFTEDKEFFTSLFKIYPFLEEYSLAHGQKLYNDAKYLNALQFYENIIILLPLRKTCIQWGQTLYKLGRFDEGITLFLKMTEQSITDVSKFKIYLHLSVGYNLKNDLVNAESNYALATSIQNSNDQFSTFKTDFRFINEYVNALRELEKFSEARSVILEFLKENQNHSQAKLLLAKLMDNIKPLQPK